MKFKTIALLFACILSAHVMVAQSTLSGPPKKPKTTTQTSKPRSNSTSKPRKQNSNRQGAYNSGNMTFTVNGVSFTMVPVSGGTFKMGSSSGESDETVHSVTLSGYMIGETEVTQALWKAVMGSNPSFHKGDNLPVERVSWNDCQEFLRKLNSMTGQRFRLPTEAEWEYAARGGSKLRGYKYSGSDNIGSVAWYTDNSGYETHTVKTKAPNELGLYDMSGNVWEWCQDWYGSYPSGSQTNPTGPSSGSLRVDRGGSYGGLADWCRVTDRNYYSPTDSYDYVGFRVAL